MKLLAYGSMKYSVIAFFFIFRLSLHTVTDSVVKFSHAVLIDIEDYQLQLKSKLTCWKQVPKDDFTLTHDGTKIFIEINELDKDTKCSFRLLVLEKNGNITNFVFALGMFFYEHLKQTWYFFVLMVKRFQNFINI